MKKLILLFSAVAGFFAASAQNVNFTFRVDMRGQAISANGVHIAGNFQKAAGAAGDWNPSATALTDANNDSIYEVTVSIPKGVYEFKFINDSVWGGAESVPAKSQVELGNGNSNRWIGVWKSDDSLAAIPFGGNAPTGMNLVRVRVDMQKETLDTTGVFVAGNMQNWTAGTTRLSNLSSNNKIYDHIFYLAAGSYEYKFINGSSWEGVPGACAVNGNRGVTVSGDTVVDKVCFAQCGACATSRYKIIFRVDMSTTCDFDSVDVAGSFQANGNVGGNWSGGVNMKDMGGKIYMSDTITLDAGGYEYKFRKISKGNVSWEGLANRQLNVSKDDTTKLTCFDKDTLCSPIPAPADVTFMVDLTNETPDANGDIFVMGNFTNPNWQGGALKMTQVPGKPGFYTATYPKMCPGTFYYKFVNGPVSNNQNEEGFKDSAQRSCVVPNGLGGFNRTYTRTSANPVVLAYVFSKCQTISTGMAQAEVLQNSLMVYPNPMSDYARLDLGNSSASYMVRITDLTGKEVRTYNQVNASVLAIEKGGLSSGIYLIQVISKEGNQGVVKLSVN